MDLSGRTFKKVNGEIVIHDKNEKIEFVAKLYQGLCFVCPCLNTLETHVMETTDLKCN